MLSVDAVVQSSRITTLKSQQRASMAVVSTQKLVVIPATAHRVTLLVLSHSSSPVLKNAEKRGFGSHKSSGCRSSSFAGSAPAVPAREWGFIFPPKMKSPIAKASVEKTTGHEAVRKSLIKRLIGSKSR